MFWRPWHFSTTSEAKGTPTAVLIAIAIPVFTGQLEKARESADAANIRSKYAEVMVDVISDGTTDKTETVQLGQQQAGWQNTEISTGLSKLATDDVTISSNNPTANGTATITYTASTGKVNIEIA